MIKITSRRARKLGESIKKDLQRGEIQSAYSLLAPVLAERTPFPKLGLIGETLGAAPRKQVNRYLNTIAEHQTEGGWVVIGTALGIQLPDNLPGAMERARQFIIDADIWYGADILGERVPGPGLLSSFHPALDELRPWREDASMWVRRTVGVAVHFWAKRTRGKNGFDDQAASLLELLAPMFWEWEMPAVKGVGWGLKTIGKYYPEILTSWLKKDILPRDRRYRALMLRKALTYLPPEQKALVTAAT